MKVLQAFTGFASNITTHVSHMELISSTSSLKYGKRNKMSVQKNALLLYISYVCLMSCGCNPLQMLLQRLLQAEHRRSYCILSFQSQGEFHHFLESIIETHGYIQYIQIKNALLVVSSWPQFSSLVIVMLGDQTRLIGAQIFG